MGSLLRGELRQAGTQGGSRGRGSKAVRAAAFRQFYNALLRAERPLVLRQYSGADVLHVHGLEAGFLRWLRPCGSGRSGTRRQSPHSAGQETMDLGQPRIRLSFVAPPIWNASQKFRQLAKAFEQGDGDSFATRTSSHCKKDLFGLDHDPGENHTSAKDSV